MITAFAENFLFIQVLIKTFDFGGAGDDHMRAFFFFTNV